MEVDDHGLFTLYEAKLQNNIAVGVRQMLEAIHRESIARTPYKDNGLRSSVYKGMLSNNSGYITWRVPYAAAQEQGGRIDPRTGKYVEFSNYTTPGTGAGFVKQAVEKVMQNPAQYFRSI